MSAWALTQTDRFKAIVVGAGVSDLFSEYGAADIASYLENAPW